MRVSSGLVRFVLEGSFLMVVAVVLSVVAPSWIAVVVILVGALLLAVGFERYAAGREQRGEPLLRLSPAEPEPALAAGPTNGRLLDAEEARAPEHAPTAEELGDAEERHQERAGETPRPRGWRGRRPRPQQPSAPDEAAAATSVLPAGTEDADEPRAWNVWVLDRLAREGAGVDTARDEERALLLMHLREFAGPDGLLPGSFDDLVRESFGELAAASGG